MRSASCRAPCGRWATSTPTIRPSTPRADWTDRLRAHMLLGELYERGGRPDIAVEHYAYVAAQRHTHETSLRARAIARLAELR